ncbi:MAG: hypothetical protein ACO1OB_18140 [Archangium sp.]
MTGLFHVHSGLRYLILLLAVANIVVLAMGMAQKQPFGKLHRILGASFAGCLHLQVILGVVLVAMGTYYPKLIGHFAMMILAAVVAQVTMSMNRRKPTPGLQLPLIGVSVALVLIVGGIMAISRGVLQSTAFGIGG